jgi:hypothetical protein
MASCFKLPHAIEAGRAMVACQTDADTRQQAGQYLERVVQSPDTWELFVKWCEQARGIDMMANPDNLSLLLLCLQLVQTKIRKQIHRDSGNTTEFVALHQQLAALLTLHQHQRVLLSPICITLAALSVRLSVGEQSLAQLIDTCCSCASPAAANQVLSPNIALRLLANIPVEMELSGLTSSQSAELFCHQGPVLGAVGRALVAHINLHIEIVAALEALHSWVRVCRVDLDKICQTPINNDSLIVVLIHILAQRTYPKETILVEASCLLTESAKVTSETGVIAHRRLLSSIETHGFLKHPLDVATSNEWDDACLALADLCGTLVTESIDDVVQEPAEALIHLLIELQGHPLTKVRMNMLDVWLTVQEVPVSQRHEHWRELLYDKVVQVMLQGVSYPKGFLDCQQSIEDSGDFDEYRRLSKDIFISAYVMQRHAFIASRRNEVLDIGLDWRVKEAALCALTATAQEVCGRVKTQGDGTHAAFSDREQTLSDLLLLIQSLCVKDLSVDTAANQHVLMLSGVCSFVGAYTSVWDLCCSTEVVYQLLVFLETAMRQHKSVITVAAKSIRSILISSSSMLRQLPDSVLLECLSTLIASSVITKEKECLETMVEGVTRFIANTPDNDGLRFAQDALRQLLGQLMQQVTCAIHHLLTEQCVGAFESLLTYLSSLQIVIRFCDNGITSVSDVLLADTVKSVLPFIESLSQQLAHVNVIESHALVIYEQLLRNAPRIMEPHLEATVKYVFGSFERTKQQQALSCLSQVVELYGTSSIESFQNLLTQLSGIIFKFVDNAQTLLDSASLMRSFFELVERYILYCPMGLILSQQFPSIVSCAVHCLEAFQGEREATRACLNVLGKLYGWRSLRLSPTCRECFVSASASVDRLLIEHGLRTTQSCMDILLGGPQVLWPACTDCTYAIVLTASNWPAPGDPQSSIAQQWMQAAHVDNMVYDQVVVLLLQLTREGPRNKSKVKMLLTDFCKIYKGEMTTDALAVYGVLQQ